MRQVPVCDVRRKELDGEEGATGTHAAPPNIGIRSTDDKAWEREARFNSHVAGLGIAVHDAKDGIGSIVMRVTLDRVAGCYLRVVLFQPWVQRLEGGIGHVVEFVYLYYGDRNDAVVSVHEMYLIACVMRFRLDETCGRHLGSDCDDDHISNDKAEDPPNSANCLGKLRRSASISLGQDSAR